MKLLFIADARSPTAAGWISYFVERGHAVTLVSTYPAAPLAGLAGFEVIPVAFSSAGGRTGSRSSSLLRALTGAGLRTALRQRLGALTLRRASKKLSITLHAAQPDLVHALRIPFEGMLAAQGRDLVAAARRPPFLVSIWGNDLTLHAPANPHMGRLTRQALAGASGVLADCHRDIRIAAGWGLPADTPTLVVPGGGGVRTQLFYPGSEASEHPIHVIQPRGVRAYVQNKAFFEAIPRILEQHPGTRFICPAMRGYEEIEQLAAAIAPPGAVELLPPQTRAEMAAWFRRSAVIVSPTTHDGTPNSLLEALACGCFPVAGDLESIREWITDGENGLLIDSRDPEAIAAAVSTAIKDAGLRQRARKTNLDLVARRAEHETVMAQAESFYTDRL